MTKASYHVIAKNNGKWNVKRTGAERASSSFTTKAAAERQAKAMLNRSGGGEVIIHGKDGRVSRRDSYGVDPASPRDIVRSDVGFNSRSPKG